MPNGAYIKISFDYNPEPSIIRIVQFQNGKSVLVTMEDGIIKLPLVHGIYYYGISAFWKTEDGKFSIGDTSSVFAVQVK